MALKRLKNDNLDVVEYNLNNDQAVLLINYVDGDSECLFFSQFEGEEKYLQNLKGVEYFRFIGSEHVFYSMKKINYKWFDKIVKRVLFLGVMKLFYYPDKNRVRFDKKFASSVETYKRKNHKNKLFDSKASLVEVSDSIKKVLIVDDSKTIQKILTKVISKSNKLSIMGIASCPSEAKKIIEKEKPDLITLDIHMPEMNGVQFLKTYLSGLNIPVVMISSVSIAEGPLILEALSHGAATYIQKPEVNAIHEVAKDIISKLEEIADKGVMEKIEKHRDANCSEFDNTSGIIAIGSSTGGTQVIQHILTSLPNQIPPIVITQHIPAVFSKAFAQRLNSLCQFDVKEAEDGEPLLSNTVYIAPGEQQFKVVKKRSGLEVAITDDPPVNRFKPSVDYLFESIRHLDIENIVGVILTGMGKDGAKGLLGLKNIGAKTIAQDKETSVVFGMPREAIKNGAVEQGTPLFEISERIVNLYNLNEKDDVA